MNQDDSSLVEISTDNINMSVLAKVNIHEPIVNPY